MSSHQSPPSGIISLESNRIPHIQQETTPARRTPLSFPGGRRVPSAMTLTSGRPTATCKPPAGQAQEPARPVNGSMTADGMITRLPAQRPWVWQIGSCLHR
jgi:hypothetical protein